MKKSLAFVSAVVLAVALFAAVAQGSSRPSAAGKTSNEALYLQARSAFVKYVSAHAPLVRAQATSPSGTPPIRGHGAAAAAPADVASGDLQSLPSVNWSGYADVDAAALTNPTAAGTFNGVSARWTIPRVSCPAGLYRNQDAFAVQWVGIDGAVNQTVEQLGTGEQCYEGVVYYYVWYEMFPSATVQEGTQACINDNVDCPQPGDQISASINVTPGTDGNNNYTLALTDYTTAGNNFSVSQPCAADVCLDQSAEWIVERPAFSLPFGFQILPLVYYSQDYFTNGTVVSSGRTSSVAGFQGGPVYFVPMMDDSGSYYLSCPQQSGPPGQLLLVAQARACPTTPPSQGGNFSVTWDSSF